MRFLKDNLLLLTLCFIAIVTTFASLTMLRKEYYKIITVKFIKILLTNSSYYNST